MKVMAVFGTRPEAIKMAPLVKRLESDSRIISKVCVTAQHREMLDQVLEIFNIVPDYDLNIMREKQSLADITSRALQGLEKVIRSEIPDIVLVHGDTTTTFAGSLAAFYNKVKVGHVEAGLRTFNKYFPYPEEMNRRLTGSIADIHFAPTSTAKRNLLNEGVKPENIYVTGNTVIDAMASTVRKNYKFKNEELNKIDFNSKRVIFITAHRRENWGKPLQDICMAFKDIVGAYKDVELVYLVHLNPVVHDEVYSILNGVERIHLLPPLDIIETHNLMDRSFMVMTDSGGIQEEAPHLGKPVLVLRDVTERPEAVEAGTLKVIGTKRENVFKEASLLLSDKMEYDSMANAKNPFGDGKACERITEAILYYFGFCSKRPDEFVYRK
ncbi:MAG TPA: UDP-N-acetylglucosamine 2-epimerase (non-hydrolyzing) [Clostridiaceae bacterium]|nr:UDP-N-acetylglucosamine 2-epimerase (non-hydrolyzing) [Clostridiaceae bacterium]